MQFVLTICVVFILSVPVYLQSGRISPSLEKEAPIGSESPNKKAAKQILDEINEQIKQEFQTLVLQRKGNLTDGDIRSLEKQSAELALKGATIIETSLNKSVEDWFYLGMLYVKAGDFGKAKRSFDKFLGESENEVQKFVEQRRVACANLSAIAVIEGNVEEAESWFSKYLENSGENQFEEVKIRLMLAEKYSQEKAYEKALSHAERAYILGKSLAAKLSNRQSIIDEIITLNEIVFQAYSEIGKPQKALEVLDDLKKMAVSLESANAYLRAVERKTRYLIENGKKTEALNFLKETLRNVNIDFKAKSLQEEITSRLRRKERQYQILGEKAIEIENIDRWLPEEVIKKLASLQGKVVLIHFWATWCGFCMSQIPRLNEWTERYGKDGLEVIGLTRYYNQVEDKVNASEVELLTKFKEKFNMQYPIAVARDAINHHNYSVQGLPTTVLIDRRGVVRYIESGAGDVREVEIERMIQRLLLEK